MPDGGTDRGTCWIEVDLAALRSNFHIVRDHLVKNNRMPPFFYLRSDPLPAGVIDQCPAGGYRNDSQRNRFRRLFFMLVYTHNQHGLEWPTPPK